MTRSNYTRRHSNSVYTLLVLLSPEPRHAERAARMYSPSVDRKSISVYKSLTRRLGKRYLKLNLKKASSYANTAPSGPTQRASLGRGAGEAWTLRSRFPARPLRDPLCDRLGWLWRMRCTG